VNSSQFVTVDYNSFASVKGFLFSHIWVRFKDMVEFLVLVGYDI